MGHFSTKDSNTLTRVSTFSKSHIELNFVWIANSKRRSFCLDIVNIIEFDSTFSFSLFWLGEATDIFGPLFQTIIEGYAVRIVLGVAYVVTAYLEIF